jgi:DNA-binding transcriptional MerR regulator
MQEAVRAAARHPTSTGYSIGRLADLTGLPVKTIRFYSDEGLLAPPGRTEAGHRRYDEADLARLQLIRSLRELSLDLPTIRRVLDGHGDLADVLAAHVLTLETRIRGLQRQLVVLRAAATSPSEDTVRRVQQLAKLDATERRQLLENFWDRALEGVQIDDETATRFRAMGSPELPVDATPAQLDAWLELAELATDEDFQATTRRNAMWVPAAAAEGGYDPDAFRVGMERAMALAHEAVDAGIEPGSAAGAAAVDAVVGAFATATGREDTPQFRGWLRDEGARHTDPRAARYWELVATVRGMETLPEARAHVAPGIWLWEAFFAAGERPAAAG